MIPRKYVSRTYTLAAGERKTISVVSDWFVVLAADEEFQVGIDQEDPEWITAGISINTAGYEQIVLYNPGASSNVVQVAFSRQEVRDSRLTVSGVVTVKEVAPFDVKDVPPNIFNSLPQVGINAGTTSLVLAADADRVQAIISNTGTEKVFLCDVLAVSGIGVPLAPGETRELSTAAEIYAHNPGASATYLAVAEIKRS